MLTVMKRREGENCGGVPAVGAGWESVHGTTVETLDEPSGRQVGPKNLFDRPARDPHWPEALRAIADVRPDVSDHSACR